MHVIMQLLQYNSNYEVSISCLKAPNETRCIRQPDRVSIDGLKKEILNNPIPLISPSSARLVYLKVITYLRYLYLRQNYDGRYANSYMYETIGGYDSRIVLQELAEQYPQNTSLKSRIISV